MAFEDFLDRVGPPKLLGCRQPELYQRGKYFGMKLEVESLNRARAVKDYAQWTGRNDPGVELL